MKLFIKKSDNNYTNILWFIFIILLYKKYWYNYYIAFKSLLDNACFSLLYLLNHLLIIIILLLYGINKYLFIIIIYIIMDKIFL